MFRLFTYLTLNAAGEPTAAGTYFDPTLDHDLDARHGINFVNTLVRDGTRRRLRDPLNMFEVEGTLLIRTASTDDASKTLYLAATRYFGPVLYYHHRQGLPICIFMQSMQSTHKKAYVCYLDRCDPVLEAQSTINTDEKLFLRRNRMPLILSFELSITLDGIITDWDDVTAVGWNARVSI